MAISREYVSEFCSRISIASRSPKANVLINRDGRACISDFSLITIISDQQTFLSSCVEGGTTPWMSPELLEPEGFGLKESRPTKESDCYALGMVVYEVLSGRAPFAPSKVPVVKVLRGERPEKPQEAWFTDGVWQTLQLCWSQSPGDRINAKAVLLGLEGNPPRLGPVPHVDGIAEADVNDQSDTTSSDSSTFDLFRLRSRAHLGIPVVQ